MEYKQIDNEEDFYKEKQSNQKIELIDRKNNKKEEDEKMKIVKKSCDRKKGENFCLLIILIIFLFFVFIYHNNLSNIDNPKNKNTLSEIEGDMIKNYTVKNIYENELILNGKIPANQDVYKIERFDSRERSFKKARKFLENCINGVLIRNISSLSNEKPIVSSIIPVYNCKNFISRAIKSIQNQNILNIEIILVDDKSTDDTLSFIKEIQKSDQRIKIISNKKNMGTLYSRCIGALSSNGKYIFPLDNDDMFLDENVFQTISNIAEKGYFDIVEFKGIKSKIGNNDILNNKRVDTKHASVPLNTVLYQPTLGNLQIWPGNKINTIRIDIVYLWAKCIRTEIYKSAINKFGNKNYNTYIVRYEDVIFNYALCNTARSYKFVGKYGIFNIDRGDSASKNRIKINDLKCYIFYLDIMINFVKDRKENKLVLVNMVLNILSRNLLKQALNSDKNVKKSFIKSLDKILNMTKISDELKNKIRKIGKQLKFGDYVF